MSKQYKQMLSPFLSQIDPHFCLQGVKKKKNKQNKILLFRAPQRAVEQRAMHFHTSSADFDGNS